MFTVRNSRKSAQVFTIFSLYSTDSGLMIPPEHYLYMGAFLFCIGIVIIITKRNAIVVLMGIELILNAANLNLIAFSQYDPQRLQGQLFALFVIVVAACEAAVALAIVLRVYQYYQTIHLDEVNELKEE